MKEYPISLQASVIEKLQETGVESFFEIQELSAKPLFDGESCRLMAPTGSGKTLAYLLPIGEKLSQNPTVNVLVLTSSSELCSQIVSVFKKYYSNISSQLIVGQANPKRIKERLKKQAQFISCTTSKAFELFTKGKFPVKKDTILILDEADQVLTGKHALQLQPFILAVKQFVTVSATYSEDSLSYLEQLEMPMIDLIATKREGEIKYSYLFCNDNKKEISLVKLLRIKNSQSSLIFVNDVRHIDHLSGVLSRENLPCGKLSSQSSKPQREKTVRDLHAGIIKCLVTTDSLARGMDFKDVQVVQYSIARDLELFIHRSGRTGRAGKIGESITLISSKDAFVLKRYSKKLSVEFKEIKFQTKPFRKRKSKK